MPFPFVVSVILTARELERRNEVVQYMELNKNTN